MQQSTIFSILMILLTRRKVTRDYLAERFSISKRTVSRYLNVLEDAGVPIRSVTGKNGGISLADDYILDKRATFPRRKQSGLKARSKKPPKRSATI